MAGAFVEIDIDDQKVQDLFARLMRRMDDLTPAMGEIGEIVHESVMRNFETHRAPDGTPWEPLAPSTIRQKKKRGRNEDDILIMNRILMGSLHPKAYSDRMEYGTDMVYGAIHQFGGLAGRGHSVEIPARPFLGVRDDDWVEIENAIQAFLLSDL